MITRRTTDEAGASTNAMMGLSGLDTTSMLTAMMKPYKLPITAVQQKQQIVVWRQERYRELITKLNDFKSKYLNYMTADTNLSSASTWRKFNVKNSDEKEEFVAISSTGDSKAKSGTIEITSMPEYSKVTGASDLLKPVEGDYAADWDAAAGRTLYINMDGIQRGITITNEMANASVDGALILFNSALDSAFGQGVITGSYETKIIQVNGADTPIEVLRLTADPAKVNQFSIFDTGATARTELGFGGQANLSNRIVPTDTLTALDWRSKNGIAFTQIDVRDERGNINSVDGVSFSINNVGFEFVAGTSIASIMNAVNASTAGVTMKYDNESDVFSIEANTAGPGQTIQLAETESGFFQAIGIGYGQIGVADGDTTIVVGGVLNPNAAATVNASNALNSSIVQTFSVTVNGVTKQINMPGIWDFNTSSYVPYTNNDQIIAQMNSSLLTAFPNHGISITTYTDPNTSDNHIGLRINNTAPIEIFSFEISHVGGSPAAFTQMGFDTLQTNATAAGTSSSVTHGAFGQVRIDGTIVQVDRSVFEYDGVLFDLKKAQNAGDAPITYSLEPDADKIVEMVQGFVEQYNELITLVSGYLTEQQDRNNRYAPLTDEERKELDEDEIKNWEEKAKVGTLRGDSNLISLQTKLRTMLHATVFDNPTGTDRLRFTLKDMGIDTSNGYSDGYNAADHGKLYIDEEKLRSAIGSSLDKISELFTRQPDTYLMGTDPKDHTFNEKNEMVPTSYYYLMVRRYEDRTGGLATHMTNILNDYAGTMRNSNNQKGILVEKAGVVNDASEGANAFSQEIYRYNERLNALWDRYDDIESQKIALLSRLETVVANSSNQAAWLTSQMGGAQ